MPQSENNSRETLKTASQGRSALQKLVIALVVAFLYYAGQIAAFSSGKNRFLESWGRWDTIAVLVGILVLGLIAFGADWLLCRLRMWRLKRLFNHLFVLILVGGILAALPNFSFAHPNITALIGLTSSAIVGASWASDHDRLVRWSANGALIISPILLIVPTQMFLWKSWGVTDTPNPSVLSAQSPQDAKCPVLLVVCDEWSWQRSSQAGRFSDLMPNMKKLCEQAVLFPNALSADRMTFQSMPKLLFQKSQDVVIHDDSVRWEDSVDSPRLDETPSLFTLASEKGYATSLIGSHLPYPHILGDQVDNYQCSRLQPLKNGRGSNIIVRLVYNLRYCHDPISHRVQKSIGNVMTPWHHKASYQGVLDSRDSLWRLAEEPQRHRFAVCHYQLPHWPFVIQADGSYHEKARQQEPEEQYGPQLEYLDVVLGEFTERLRQNGTYDDALIVFTSDHSWRVDPNKDEYLEHDPDWDRRVPLVIKLPGQQSAHTFDQSLANNQLRPLFEAVFRGERDTDRLLELLRRLPEESGQNELPISVSKSE